MHGTGGDSKENWFPWLKDKLEADGYKVWLPDLPGADRPSIIRYNQFILSSDWQFNQDSIIVGHSSGAVEILGLLQALPKETVVKAVYLVGVFKDNLGWEVLDELFTTDFNLELIKTKAEKFVFIHSDNDPYCPLAHARYFHKKLGGDLFVLSGQKHFSTSTYGEKYRQFPFLAHLILEDAVDVNYLVWFKKLIQKNKLKFWLDGGWAVDILVGKQTRKHEDLDIVIKKGDLDKFKRLMQKESYFLVERDDTRPHNFVLVDDQAHLVDVHVVKFDQLGNGIYGPEKNHQAYPAWAFGGKGVLGGEEFPVLEAKYLLGSRKGYKLRPKDLHDIKLLKQLVSQL